MNKRRFFVEKMAEGAEQALLTGREAHHALDVLRLRPGDCIELHDGHGAKGWSGIIEEVRNGTILVRITGRADVAAESPLMLTLALAHARSDKMETVLRQATELGVVRIVAFRAQRSQYGLSELHIPKKRERWTKIMRDALCQSERSRLPELVFLSDTVECIRKACDWKAHQEDTLNIVGSEREDERELLSLREAFPISTHVLVAIGPEGGWAREELDRFSGAGFFPVHLGPRILRYETAAVAFLTAAQLLWGDFGIPLKEMRS